jgi:hypothetical protein
MRTINAGGGSRRCVSRSAFERGSTRVCGWGESIGQGGHRADRQDERKQRAQKSHEILLRVSLRVRSITLETRNSRVVLDINSQGILLGFIRQKSRSATLATGVR